MKKRYFVAKWMLRAFFCLSLLGGCGNEMKRPIVVGAKDFAEQQIAAEIVAQTLRAQDIPAEVDDVSRDSLDVLGALWVGDIDLYVEYSGSVLSLVGHPPIPDPAESVTAAQDRLAQFELNFGPAMGFRNDFSVLAKPGTPAAASPATLSGLADSDAPLRVGMSADFRKRAVDGYESLVRRYGWRAEPSLQVPSSPEGKSELYSALLEEKIDIAIGFLTDSEIRDFDLVRLADDLGFFSAYVAAPLIRSGLLKQRPRLRAALAGLEDRVSTEEMRKMVAQTGNPGAGPFEVAARFLNPDLSPAIEGDDGLGFSVAVGGMDAASGQTGEVLLGLRKAFPGRSVQLEEVSDPLTPLMTGDVRYALAGGSDFFLLNEDGRAEIRSDASALVHVDFDVLHVLVRRGEARDVWRDGARLGVGPRQGISARAAPFLKAGTRMGGLELIPADGEGPAAVGRQARAVQSGRLDGLVVMAEMGHPFISDLLEGGLQLAPMTAWARKGNQVAFPFLRPMTIPAATYPGQSSPLPSVGTPVVLAAKRSDASEGVGVVGPGSAAIGRALPVGAGTVARIRETLGVEVRVDPSLPLATAARRTLRQGAGGITPSPMGSFANLLVVVAIVVVLRLYLSRPLGP